MVGYSKNRYRLWNPLEKKIFVARNVIFDESRFFDNTFNLYIQDNVAISDNSQEENSVGNNKSNIIEDI